MVRFLVEQGADVNARQEGGFTALDAATQNGDAELIEFLLKNGANPDITARPAASEV